MPKSCDGCTLCCKLLEIHMDDGSIKVQDEWCKDCTGKGCGIYDARPTECREFVCIWLGTQQRINGTAPLPSAMRPDRSGVILTFSQSGALTAHCETPEAYKRQPMYAYLLRHARKHPVIIHKPGVLDMVELRPDGRLLALTRGKYNPATREYSYSRKAIFEDIVK